jgi:hypothetical protein
MRVSSGVLTSARLSRGGRASKAQNRHGKTCGARNLPDGTWRRSSRTSALSPSSRTGGASGYARCVDQEHHDKVMDLPAPIGAVSRRFRVCRARGDDDDVVGRPAGASASIACKRRRRARGGGQDGGEALHRGNLRATLVRVWCRLQPQHFRVQCRRPRVRRQREPDHQPVYVDDRPGLRPRACLRSVGEGCEREPVSRSKQLRQLWHRLSVGAMFRGRLQVTRLSTPSTSKLLRAPARGLGAA